MREAAARGSSCDRDGQTITSAAVPEPTSLTRRVVLAAGGATLATACAAPAHLANSNHSADVPTASRGSTMPFSPSLAGTHVVLPLPFGPSSLNGLSERLITSHHANNYAGAVRNLNSVEKELARINSDTPPFVVAALREKELTFRNSKTLHEAYFGNLGGDGKRSGAIEAALGEAYGSSSRWEEQMRMTGVGLGGGSGWAILGFELDTGGLRTFSSGNHTQTLATAVPLLVLDMYEHAYQMDFGASAPKYLDAFFANVKWDEVNRRLERAQKLGQAWRGMA